MRNIATKADNVGDTLPADAFNSDQNEFENAVTDTGQTLDPNAGPDSDLHMLGKAMCVYSAAAHKHVDSGAANAYVLSAPSTNSLQAAPSLVDGMYVRFMPANNNTGACSLNLNGLGVKDLTAPNGDDLIEGDVVAGIFAHAVYDSASDSWMLLEFKLNGGTGRNLLINGAMEIDQEHEGAATASTTASGTHIIDGWLHITSATSGVLSYSRDSTAPSELYNSLKVACTTAKASLGADDAWHIEQRVEGYKLRNVDGGHITISFWFRSSVTGDYGVTLVNNSSPKRSSVNKITVSTADVFERHCVTVDFDTASIGGSWDLSNGIGLKLAIILAAGSNNQTATLGTWTAKTPIAPSGQANLLSSTSNTCYLSGVQIEPGRRMTTYEYLAFPQELVRAERYYFKSYPVGTVPGSTINSGLSQVTTQDASGATIFTIGHMHQYAVGMRSAPSVTIYNPATGASNSVKVGPLGSGSATPNIHHTSQSRFYIEAVYNYTLGSVMFIQYHTVGDARL